MRKIVSTLIFAVLLTNCSNISVKELPSEEKKNLTYNLESVKENLKQGKNEVFKEFFHNSFKNKYILNELEGVDFTSMSIFYSTPTFKGDEADNVIAFSTQGKTFYYGVTYKYINGQWKIINIIEKGDTKK